MHFEIIVQNTHESGMRPVLMLTDQELGPFATKVGLYGVYCHTSCLLRLCNILHYGKKNDKNPHDNEQRSNPNVKVQSYQDNTFVMCNST